MPLLFLDEQPQRGLIPCVEYLGSRAFEQSPALRVFPKLELLEGLDHYRSFSAAEPVAVVPGQPGLGGVRAKIPQPIGFSHKYTVS